MILMLSNVRGEASEGKAVIDAEIIGPSAKPLPPTTTPEVWLHGRWVWQEAMGRSAARWIFLALGTDPSREQAEKYSLPGDILIRVPAST